MKSSVRMLRNTLRQQLSVAASTSRLAPAVAPSPSSSAPSSSRLLHTTQALDPKDDAAAEVAANLGMATNAGGATSTSPTPRRRDQRVPLTDASSLIYVPLRHLHKSTAVGKPQERLEVPLSSHVFGISPRRDILHSAVVYYLDSLRSGTASTKTRGEVAYSTRKLMQQKGSGKARVGSRGSPTRVGGGVAHGPKPRDFATQLPRKVRELALRSALSAKWQEGHLHVVPSYFWDPPPRITRDLFQTLRKRGWQDSLFLTAPREPQPAEGKSIVQRPGRPSALDPIYTTQQKQEHSGFIRNFIAAVRNIPNTEFIRLDTLTEEAHKLAKTPEDKKKPGELPAYKILHKEHLVLDLGAVEWLEEKLGGAIFHDDAGQEMSAEELVEMLGEDEGAVDELVGAREAEGVDKKLSSE